MTKRKAVLYLAYVLGPIALAIGLSHFRLGSRADASSIVNQYNVGAVHLHPSLVVRITDGLYQCRYNSLDGIQVKGFGCRKI